MSLENILTGNLIKKSFHLDNGFSTSTTETHAKLQNERSTNEINSTNILNNHIMSTNWIAILILSNTLISLLYENGFDTCVVWHEYECDSGVSGANFEHMNDNVTFFDFRSDFSSSFFEISPDLLQQHEDITEPVIPKHMFKMNSDAYE